jgi:hypothetical protein
MRARRILPFAAAALVVAGCSTDLPTDSGLIGAEDRALFTEHEGELEVSVCKSWGEDDEPTPDIGWTFNFTATAAPAAGEVTVFLDPAAGENGRLRCEPLGTWPAGTEVTVVEQVPPGFELDVIGFFLREGGDEFGPSVDLAAASSTFLVDDVEAVLFKNVGGVLPLEISKTAAGSYDRTVTWELTKTVDPASHSGAPGDSFDSDWTVTATKSENSGNYQVSGVITVANPNTFDVAFSLTDVLNDGTAADISCPDTDDNTGTLPAGGTIDCAYTASPADDSADENTATVTSDLGEESTTEGFTWTENVIGDDTVFLGDERVGYLEVISGTTVEIFPEIFACPTDVSLYVDGVYEYTEVNKATLDGTNTALQASAEVTVRCEIPETPEGCTPGFWRQAHHYPYWTGASPVDAWTTHFADPGTHQGPGRNGATFNGETALGDAVEFGGGGVFALARHAVAALLNANSGDVDYPLSAAEVVALVNDALASGDFEGAKNTLEGYNELGCTVDKSGGN